MTRVVITTNASRDLADLVERLSLPTDAPERVRRTIRNLSTFPDLGAPLGQGFGEQHFVVGPWSWMLIVYRHYPEPNEVAVLAIKDGRTSTAPTANR